METNKLGSQAVMIGSILGGNILGTIATSKVKFLQGNLGRIILFVIGILLAVKVKSDILKGSAMGVALTGASGLTQNLTKGISGFEGISGLSGDGNYGVGDIITGPDGMMYMVNGVGELEPYEEIVYVDEDGNEYPANQLSGTDIHAVSGVDEVAIAGA